MAILLLNRLPFSLTPYQEWLKDAGVPIVLFTSQEKLASSNERLEDYAGYYAEAYSFPRYDFNGLLEMRALDLHKKYNFKTILALDEFTLLRAAALRRRLGLAGQTPESATAYRDKLIMKDILARGGVAVTPQRAVSLPSDVLDFIEDHGYPVVVKPRTGAASLGIRIIRDKAELEAFMVEGLTNEIGDVPHLMIEKYVDGLVYHIDGLVLHGKPVLVCPAVYFNDSLSFKGGAALGSSTLDAHDPLRKRLQDFVKKVLAVLPTPQNTTFHAEVFHTADDRLLLGEIASRTGGGRINDTLAAAFGLNINQAWARADCGLPVEVPAAVQTSGGALPNAYGWLSIVPKPNTFLMPKETRREDWVIEFRQFIRPDQKMGPAQNNADHIAHFIIQGKDRSQVFERLGELQAWIDRQFIPADSIRAV